ncbi:hypothetical protein TL16_g06855 [Triparma laevis f. inornata]|uniref:Peptidase M60 domain-containing protein n=1 Tax=Triparma laevis f. inornata TaxID=1714386 RepID=A0A9W7AQ71_9STRA|nr:hypothetical protein TL16_g06855 [Triparma laevis f. inornata]
MRVLSFLAATLPTLALGQTCPPEYSADDNSYSLSQYGEDRNLCTNACNIAGYCCTLGSGGCNAVPCNTGCHIAWWTETVDECYAECDRANSMSCEYTWHHVEVADLNLNPSWAWGVGVSKCTGAEQCGCDANADPSWGTANDCSTSACHAGCDLANADSLRSRFFHGETVKIDTQIGLISATLLDAINKLTRHFDGTTALSSTDLEAAAQQFYDNSALLETLMTTMEAALDLVDVYESSKGPLFIGGTSSGFNREGSVGDSHHEARIMLKVQQAVLDNVFSGSLPEMLGITADLLNENIIEPCTSFLQGRKWQTANFFPGSVDAPSDTSAVYDVAINATMKKYWGKEVCFCDEPILKPLGFYLPPGEIGTVEVPQRVVDAGGFRVQVGAHIADHSDKSFHSRMDRVTTTYDIKNKTTHFANPLGGGIYILVPYQANEELVTVKVGGGVVKTPIYSATSVKLTSEEEWNEVRTAPGVWADFESDKYLMQVPREWIYGLGYTHVKELMEGYEKAMVGINEMNGYVPSSVLLNCDENGPRANGPSGASTHWLVNNPVDWSVTYHEAGHCQLQSMYRGETEASNNLFHAYVRNVKFNISFDVAFAGSLGHAVFTPDQAAVDWMVTEQYGNGEEMDYSNTPDDQFRYQQRGYGKYADMARLWGWNSIINFYHTEHLEFMAGATNTGEGLHKVDSRTLRLGMAAGVDLRPLIDFWGIDSVDSVALKQKTVENGLKPSKKLKELFEHYATLIPMNEGEFNAHFDAVWPGKRRNPGDCADVRYGCGWYNVRMDVWDLAEAQKAKERLLAFIEDEYGGVVDWADEDDVQLPGGVGGEGGDEEVEEGDGLEEEGGSPMTGAPTVAPVEPESGLLEEVESWVENNLIIVVGAGAGIVLLGFGFLLYSCMGEKVKAKGKGMGKGGKNMGRSGMKQMELL